MKDANEYWGHGNAPVECQLRIVCSDLNRDQFRDFVWLMKKNKIWYRDDWSEKLVVLAFKTKEEMEFHAVMLEINKKLNGK